MDSLRKRPPAPQRISQSPRPPMERPFYQTKITLPAAPPATQKNGRKKRFSDPEKKLRFFARLRKIIFFSFIIILIAMVAYVGFFLWKSYSVSKKMSIGSNNNSSLAQDVGSVLSSISGRQPKELDGQANGRINILLLGAAGEHKPGKNLTDTVMVMSIDTKDKKLALLSLPRDLYVKIPDDGRMTKINGVYQYGLSNDQGIEPIKETVSSITGLDINYYLVVDFDAFTKIIDQIGGVNVTVERDILDTSYPGPNYSYQTFELSKGFHTLDGETTLKYVRERHDDPEGDFGRAKRQQQVIQAVKNKLFSAQTLFNVVTLSSILDTLGENVKTDIGIDEMEGLIALSKTVDTQNIENVVVDAWKPESLLKVSHIQLGGVNAFILVPRIGNYSEIQDTAQNIFDQEILKRRHENIANEEASVAIINRSDDHGLPQKIRSLLTDRLGMKNVAVETEKETAEQDASVVQDNTTGQKLFTLDELTKKLPAKLSTENSVEPKKDYDFVVVLGKDLVDTYGYEESTVEEFNKAQDEQNDL